MTINCDDPPVGFVGVAYSHTFPILDGTPPYSVGVTSGMAPPPLSINDEGVMTGVPNAKGFYTFTLTASDALDQEATVECSIQIAGACVLEGVVAQGGE